VISHKQETFAKILKLDGLCPDDITNSLKLDKNINNICKAGQGVGKSGSFFFHSFDHRFILKTMKSSEKKVILDLVDNLIDYYEVVNN
jgi:1-phosphatidylinositol-4-phosphate 5-kinase